MVDGNSGGAQNSCMNCGSCCTKGGPVLRYEDEHLVKLGKIASKHLYTMRRGELAFDHRKKELLPLTVENIRLKVGGGGESMECSLFEEGNRCSVYSFRPSECRSYKCWSLREVEMKYDDPPLTRKDLLGGVEGLWELIENHEERCSIETLQRLVGELDGDKADEAVAGINDIVTYDRSLRRTFTEKGNVDPEMVDFMLGRPIDAVIVMFGMELQETEGKIKLVPLETK